MACQVLEELKPVILEDRSSFVSSFPLPFFPPQLPVNKAKCKVAQSTEYESVIQKVGPGMAEGVSLGVSSLTIRTHTCLPPPPNEIV